MLVRRMLLALRRCRLSLRLGRSSQGSFIRRIFLFGRLGFREPDERGVDCYEVMSLDEYPVELMEFAFELLYYLSVTGLLWLDGIPVI